MIKHKRYASFLFLALLCFSNVWFSTPAEAARFSGAYLRKICSMDKSGNELIKGGHTACQAYIAGVLDYQNVLKSMNMAPKVDICLPKKATMWDLHKIVLVYLIRNHTHDQFIAAPAVIMALHQVYPCKR